MPITTEPKGPKPPKVGLVKVQLFYNTNGFSRTFTAANVLHVRWSDGLNHSAANLLTLATDVYNAAVTAFLASITGQWQLIQCVASSLGGDGLSAVYTNTTAGGQAAPTYPPQVAVTVSWQAGISWRGGRPRTYLPGVPSGASQAPGSAQLLSGYTSALATRCNTFISTISGFTIGGAFPILTMPSYYSRGAFRPVPLTFDMVSAVVHDRLDSQRRRSGKESTFGID